MAAEGDEGVLGFPYLVHRLRALYFNYIEEVAQQCHTKCLDEFYTTRIIYWDFLTYVLYSLNSPEESGLVKWSWRY